MKLGLRLLCATVAAAAMACSPARPAPAAPSMPPRASRAFSPTTPAALRDGAEAAIPSRARVAQAGAIRFEQNGDAVDVDDLGETAPDPVTARVVGDVTRARVQVRADGDDARLLLWIDRGDLAPAVVKAHALVDPTTGTRGAVVRPGALASIVDRDRDDRAIVVDDGSVRAHGHVPAAVLGDVFEARPPRAVEPTGSLAGGTEILAAPRAGAETIAIAVAPVGIRALAPAADGWVEIELDRDWMYVRGFVPVDRVSAADSGIGGGISGSSFSMSDTETLILPAGACLYARAGGPVIGVNTADRQRYVTDGDGPGWRRIAVQTEWGIVWPEVHFPEHAGRPAGDFDRCPRR